MKIGVCWFLLHVLEYRFLLGVLSAGGYVGGQRRKFVGEMLLVSCCVAAGAGIKAVGWF